MEKSIEQKLTEVTAAQKIAKMNEHLAPAMQKIHPAVSFNNGKLEIQLQVGHPGEDGAISGCYGTHAVEAITILHQYYQNQLPSRETAIVITKLEEAWLWLKKRELDRDQRGVLQTDKK